MPSTKKRYCTLTHHEKAATLYIKSKSLQVCLNQDVLVHLLYFIDDKHLLPIFLTCRLFQDAVIFSHREYKKQSLSCYCYRVETLKWVLGVIAPIESSHWKTIIKASCAYGSIEVMQIFHVLGMIKPVLGMKKHAQLQQKMVTWKCCSGFVVRILHVLGIDLHV